MERVLITVDENEQLVDATIYACVSLVSSREILCMGYTKKEKNKT